MIGLEVRFLAGRFHGNAWNHAHNEGVAEWPPSPWRLLRALVASAYELGISPERAAPLLEKLRGLPAYLLPAAREAHTRHYMPDVDDPSHKKTKVFDTFVAVDGGVRDPQPLTLLWPVILDPGEREILQRLAGGVRYLGRGESWSDLTVVELAGDRFDCWPDERSDAAFSTTLMTLEPATAFEEWAKAQAAPKRKGAPDVPRSLWDVLTFSGERFRDEGWTRVPGTRLSRYVFASPPFRGGPAIGTRIQRGVPARRPTAAQFAIRSAVLPRLTEALSVGERVRTALMSWSEKISGSATAVFSGHVDGPLNHRHAFYLSGGDGDGHISHVVVSAKMGFDEDDVRALQSLRRVWGRDGHDLELILTGLWTDDDRHALGGSASSLLGEGVVWESVTPFVPTRHPKMVRGQEVDGIADQIRVACLRAVGCEPVNVIPIDVPRHHTSWARYQRRRRSGDGRRGPDRAYGARLAFAEPIAGPLALGFGAHFGLGLFSPAG